MMPPHTPPEGSLQVPVLLAAAAFSCAAWAGLADLVAGEAARPLDGAGRETALESLGAGVRVGRSLVGVGVGVLAAPLAAAPVQLEGSLLATPFLLSILVEE